MFQKPSNQVMSGNYYFQFRSLTEGTYLPPSLSPYPSMLQYALDTTEVSSTNENTISLGSKTFTFTFEVGFYVGDLIIAEAIDTVHGTSVGYVLASVTSFSRDGDVKTIVADAYQFTGSGTYSDWRIKQQWGSTTNAIPLNVVQNPNSPHTAKLTVYDWEYSGGSAQFSVPNSINSETTITIDTPTHYAGYTFTQWKWNTYIVEDNSDLHKPWLGTTVTARVKISKVTTTLSGSTEEFEFRDYTHTFTEDDFNPDSEWFVAGSGHSPSTCENFSEDYIDNFTSTFDLVRDSEGTVISLNNVTYSFAEQSWIVGVTPSSFFEPPTA